MEPFGATSARSELNCDLAAEVLRKFGTVMFRAIGSSMIPAIWPGDTLRVHSVPIDKIDVGDVILFWRGRGFCAHRVVSRAGKSLITAGDSILTADSPVTSEELLGIVVTLNRNGKDIQVARRLSLSSQVIRYGFRRWNRLLRLYVRCHGVTGAVIQRIRRLRDNTFRNCSAL